MSETNGFLYAFKDDEVDNLCKKRNYHLLDLKGQVLYSDESADDLLAQGYTIESEGPNEK